jgi:parallel beta-helix repeat protein
MSNRIISLCTIISLSIFSFASADKLDDLDYKKGELIVRFAPKANGLQRTKAERNVILSSIDGGNVKRSYKLVSGLTVVKLPASRTVKNSIDAFKNTPGILYAEPNYKIKLYATMPNDTYFDNLWGMHNTGQTGGSENADINAPKAWDILTDAEDIIVAVIDTGVDYVHEDLAANMWVNEAELNGDPCEDDDDNNYVNDIYGYDFSGYVPADQDSDPMDEHGHGTHVAGTIGAVGNNTKGVAGVCWNVKIMALKIMPPYYLSEWEAFVDNAVEAIAYATDNGANVINASWGIDTNYSQSLRDAIETAGNSGILFVAAAGNDTSNNDLSLIYPSCYDLDNIISVLATNHNDNKSSFSNYGATTVDIGAPGSDVYSCQPDDQYGYGSGTSMAAPHVAGACALVWSRGPALSHLEVKDIILDTADKLDSLDGRCVTDGRLNLYNALLEAPNVSLSVDDGIGPSGCVVPDDYIEYQISYSNPITEPNEVGYVGDVNDVSIIDYLPDEVDFISTDPNTGEYDPNGHTYTWNIGKLSPGQGGTLLLKVQANESAEPLSDIVNTAELTGDIAYLLETEQTQVCCFGGEVIYVDASINAPDPNGSSWNTAFNNLVDALAAATICDEIWVAKAENAYKPTTNPANHTATFSLLKGVGLYGGFFGDEEQRYERNWFENETILSGVIDSADNEPNCVDYVAVNDANNVPTILDGFTITGGSLAGVHCEQSSPLISHNMITDNAVGIYFFKSEQPVIKNNWLYKNDYGLYFESPTDVAVVRNNTIANNDEMGIYLEDGTEPQISNCIFTGHPEDSDLVGCYATYSYIEYPIVFDPNTTPPDIGQGNIDGDPNYILFLDGDDDDYLLDSDSSCIDAGDPNANYSGERDIDKQFRLLDGNDNGEVRVDMGADEYCNEGDENDVDFNDDGIVDTLDLAEMGGAWLVDANDPDWDSQYYMYDLYADDVIDFVDFAYFNQEWLWVACWKMPDIPTEPSMYMGGGWYSRSMLMTETQEEGPIESQPYSEPTIEKQITQIEELLAWLYEVADTMDEDTWLNLVTSLEDMLKELEGH